MPFSLIKLFCPAGMRAVDAQVSHAFARSYGYHARRKGRRQVRVRNCPRHCLAAYWYCLLTFARCLASSVALHGSFACRRGVAGCRSKVCKLTRVAQRACCRLCTVKLHLNHCLVLGQGLMALRCCSGLLAPKVGPQTSAVAASAACHLQIFIRCNVELAEFLRSRCMREMLHARADGLIPQWYDGA